MVAAPVRKRRTQYLIAKSFQLRFSLFLTGVGVVVTTAVGAVLYHVLSKTQSLLIGSGMVTSPQVIDFLMDQRSLFIYSLLAVFVGVTLLLMIFGIVVSHRLAGPIFALTRKMNALAQGNFNATLDLRRGDEFQDLKEKYNTLVHGLQNQVKSELIKINEIMEAIEKLISEKKISQEVQPDLKSTLHDLESYYNYKKNLIEPDSSPARFTPKDATDEEILL